MTSDIINCINACSKKAGFCETFNNLFPENIHVFRHHKRFSNKIIRIDSIFFHFIEVHCAHSCLYEVLCWAVSQAKSIQAHVGMWSLILWTTCTTYQLYLNISYGILYSFLLFPSVDRFVCRLLSPMVVFSVPRGIDVVTRVRFGIPLKPV